MADRQHLSEIYLRTGQLVRFIQRARTLGIPHHVVLEAKHALIDYLGDDYRGGNRSRRQRGSLGRDWLASGQTTPALAMLINGTMAHAADFDDTQPGGAGHPSGPCWSTALALGQAQNLTEQQVLAAFITGYEIMARLGSGGTQGIGRNLQRRGFHPIAISARAALLKLSEQQTAAALSITTALTSGIKTNFGRETKPLEVGQANRNSLLSIKLAQQDFSVGESAFEHHHGYLFVFTPEHSIF